MGDRRAPHPYAKRVANPAVRAKMRQVIGKRVSASDADDIMQAAFIRLMMTPDLPEAEDDLLAYVVVVTRACVANAHRKARRGDVLTDDGEDPRQDEVGESLDRIAECKRLLEFATRAVDEGLISTDVARWAARLAEGHSYEDIASEEGVSASKVKMSMMRAREVLQTRWKIFSGVSVATTLAAVLAFLMIRHPRPDSGIGADRIPPVPTATTTVAAPTPAEEAQQHRDRAAEACRAKDWGECAFQLDSAAYLEPSSDARPEVKAMRKAIWEADHPKDRPDKPVRPPPN